MDINQSTNDARAQIIDNLLAQASIGDPTDYPHVTDLREHVLLVHGDLGTGERLFAVKQSRLIEDKEMCRLQPVIFVMGLFHLLMACAEAIWRMYIEPKEVRTDREPNSMYNHACGVRLGDSGCIGSKPSFRMMHEIIHQSAYARMLDCWRVKVKMRLRLTMLEAFAESKPTWDQIVELSLVLAQTYVDHEHTDDQEFRNNSLILGQLIQYVELAHAMKHGDIGRVEATFLHWVFVFKSVGKHKYATHLVKVMNDLRYVYPERLKRAIRLNWLCNPTGTVNSFRAIDWLVELLNLFTKVIYGSSGSSRTFDLILKQSPLISIFRWIMTIVQDNFHLLHRSVRHAPADLTKTLQFLRERLEHHRAYEQVPGRTAYQLKDHFREGMQVLQMEKTRIDQDGASETVVAGIEIEDLEV
ncbi:hypothetical protein BDN71DRAFT_1402611 [Pleurotus eryngii]|uniref:DUF6589 domain-containing protein n=1 Tax=Pleurotus eryngii TaxID=5323 RepID=A0A9P6D9P7_PLEER|nr:hypothetical protein BDN71DRAFT_1402611 [Pleurotus eryngii]